MNTHTYSLVHSKPTLSIITKLISDQFGQFEVVIFVVDVHTTDNVLSYITTMRALKFDEDGAGIPIEEYPDHFLQVFDLTSTEETTVQIYYPDVVAAV